MPALDVGWASLAGFAAGYVMALGAYWLEGIVGIPRLDFGHTGIKYLGGEKPGFWIVGIVFHLVDSVLLALLYAVAVYPKLPMQADVIVGAIAGIAYAIVLWFVLAMLIVMTLMGSGPFGVRSGSWKPAIASLVLHVVYGAILGGVYIPRLG
ncbi:MAG: hypothetical protein HY553_03975 [Elusimicrobia bacterium]|nr:hypothetical protein [Elusimicrobiota bacterium]